MRLNKLFKINILCNKVIRPKGIVKIFNGSWIRKIRSKWRKSHHEISFMAPNIRLLNIQGLWCIQEKPASHRHDFHFLYPRVMLLLAVVDSLVTHLTDIVLSLDRIEYVCENLVILVLYGVFITSFATLLTHEDGIRDLLTRMKNMNDPKRFKDDEEVMATRTCQKLCNIFTIGSMIVGTLFYLCIIIAYQIAMQMDMVPRDLIYYRGWYFYNEAESPAFELTMIYRTVVIWLAMMGLISSDTFLFVLLVHTVKQFEILRRRMENLRVDAEKNVERCQLQEVRKFGLGSVSKTIQIFHCGRSKEDCVVLEMEKILYECLTHHNEMNRFVQSYTYFYNARLSYQVLANLIGSCIFYLYILVTPGQGIMRVAVTITCFSSVIWFLAFGILASKVIDERTRLCDALYSSDWYDAPEPLKRSIRIMMTASNRPVAFVVMGFVPLSVETFAQVMKTTYSYFRILVNLRQ